MAERIDFFKSTDSILHGRTKPHLLCRRIQSLNYSNLTTVSSLSLYLKECNKSTVIHLSWILDQSSYVEEVSKQGNIVLLSDAWQQSTPATGGDIVAR